MFKPLCICAETPRIATRTKIVFLLHYAETRLPTNTGWLGHCALSNSHYLVRGLLHKDSGLEDLFKSRELSPESTAVLFPSPGAIEVGEWAKTLDPQAAPAVIVPDGTWRQAKRMTGREPRLQGLTHVRIAPGPMSQYRLREEPHPNYVCTIEAVMRLLDRLEEEPVSPKLERAFRLMVERTLWARGKLSADRVTGGISEEARTWGQRSGGTGSG